MTFSLSQSDESECLKGKEKKIERKREGNFSTYNKSKRAETETSLWLPKICLSAWINLAILKKKNRARKV